ncbi:alanine racemase [bacterium]|nr:alanine racemase [bacterium]
MGRKWRVRRPAWVEIYLDRIAANARLFQRKLGRAQLAAVVKADAYGHGIEGVSAALYRSGVRWFCVSTGDEAHRLRDVCPRARILLMGPVDRRDLRDLLLRNVTFTLFTIDFADELDSVASRAGRRAVVHLKIDSGMNRLGVPWRQAGDFSLRLGLFRGVSVEGVYSHLATALENPSFMQIQRRRFERSLQEMRRLGVIPRIRHLANTGGVLVSRAFHYDMARVGLGLYGVTPQESHAARLGLSEAMVVKARLISVKWVEPGEGVGYGLAGRVRKLTPVGVVQVGYADGLDWRRGADSVAHFRGRPLPFLGRICMDQSFLDLTAVADDISVGDPILILGDDGLFPAQSRGPDFWEMSKVTGTIPYEVMTDFGKRLPRIYKP